VSREDALRKWNALRRMTTARGCSPHEAATAAAIAAGLARRWGFSRVAQDARARVVEDWGARVRAAQDAIRRAAAARAAAQAHAAEREAARKFGWEYRRCGKRRCWCASRPLHRAHGPYRYRKVRRGRKVVSVYVGKV
jgi:N-methylhydantoinase A/oxoprolinase/acetone carboxylase beta subunit